jgi:acetoin utilization protein AcuB
MYVGQMMTKKVITTKPDEMVEKVFQSLIRKKIAHLPVIENKCIVGIISDRDLRKSLINKTKDGRRKPIGKLKVSEVMTKKVITISPDVHVMDAVDLMLNKRIGSLPVIDNGKLAGIVTKDDFLGVFVEMLNVLNSSSTLDVELVDEIDDYQKVQTVLRNHGCNVLSYSASRAGKGDSQVCHFRLELCPVKPVVKDLKKHGVKVVEAYGND